MKICVVSNQVKKTISGIGLHTNNLVNALLRDGHRVWVIAPGSQRPDGDLPYTFLAVPEPWFSGSQARWIALSWNFMRALQRLLKDETPDLVHFTDARESLFYRGAVPAVGNINDTYSAELHSLPYYRARYDDWRARWAYYHFVHFCEGIALRRLAAVIANSQFTAGIVRAQYHVSPQNLHVCVKSIDPGQYAAAGRREAMPAHPPRILFVGTNMQRKGLPVLIESAPRVMQRVPDAEFWVVGEDRALPRMKRLCAQAGVLEHFHFTGWKSQRELIDTVYAQTDVFAMPSLTEALGMVFVEAMASGVPVVGTAVGGIPEIITDRVNGRLVPPESSTELAEAIIEILCDPQAAERYRAAGLQTVGRFSVAAMMQCTYAIYQTILPAARQENAVS